MTVIDKITFKRLRWKLANWLSNKAISLSDILLKERIWKYDFCTYQNMPKNTLGYHLSDYLKANKIQYNPKLIKHDFKHILLGYEMKMKGEIELHSFLIGNKDFNLMGFTYLVICLMILPETFKDAKKAYYRGKKAIGLSSINLMEYVEKDINDARKLLKI